MDTIFALATSQGRAGVAVIRISGSMALHVAALMMKDVPVNRGVRKLHDRDGIHLDDALVLTFLKDRSFTGEPVVELHLHGSIATVTAVLRVLGDTNSRLAEPGEFTRRAMENGKLDLAQVEGLADLIDAETEAQRRQALRVFSGELGDIVASWRSRLLRAMSLIEATIDFVDEDVPVDVMPEVQQLLAGVLVGLREQIGGVGAAERVRNGFEVAIVGPPNVGKSTLLNRLAGRDAAITSHIAGTTRDVIEVKMDLAGLPVTLLDTAGLRDTEDEVERIGVVRAKQRASTADLRIYLDVGERDVAIELQDDDLLVGAKSDTILHSGFSISAKNGDGIDRLVKKIGKILSRRVIGAGLAVRERHRLALINSLSHLETVLELFASEEYLVDIVADELRQAVGALDALVGRISVEDVLSEIFSSFCIGK